jgi:hypothetical protein
MSIFTRYKLWRMRRAIGPSAAFRRSLGSKLSIAWVARHGRSTAHAWVLRFVVAPVASVFLAAGAGVGAYAYTSPEVTNGTVLYPVKQALEKVEEATKHTPEAKAAFYVKQIERREAEERVVKKKSAPKAVRAKTIEKQIEDLNEKLEQTDVSTTSLQKDPVLARKLEKQLTKRKERLEKSLEQEQRAPQQEQEQEQEESTQAEASREHLKNIEKQLQKTQAAAQKQQEHSQRGRGRGRGE